MNKHDWLFVGLKLLGVYFAILGIAILSMSALHLVMEAIEAARSSNPFYVQRGRTVNLLSSLQPLAYLVCAFVLLRRTDWCLREILPGDPGSIPDASSNA